MGQLTAGTVYEVADNPEGSLEVSGGVIQQYVSNADNKPASTAAMTATPSTTSAPAEWGSQGVQTWRWWAYTIVSGSPVVTQLGVIEEGV